MSDEMTTVMQLRTAVDAFVAERDWHQYHNGKDLAVSIAIEAGELLEEFQWRDAEAVAQASSDPEARERIRFELADILIYCLGLSNAMDLDVSDAIADKLVISGQKYPTTEYKGRFRRPDRRGDFTVD